jgi:hypothetical protein
MSFGVSVGDIISISAIVHGLWKNLADSPDQFRAIRTEWVSELVHSAGSNLVN